MITELYTVHSTEILRYCISLCGGTGFAEDLLQETFLRALSNLDTLEELDARQRRAWLYKVARNLFYDAVRRQSVERKYLEPPQDTADGGICEVEAAILLAELPPDLSQLFKKRYFEGYTSKELAQQYGLSPAGVRSALSRARRLLREKLARQ